MVRNNFPKWSVGGTANLCLPRNLISAKILHWNPLTPVQYDGGIQNAEKSGKELIVVSQAASVSGGYNNIMTTTIAADPHAGQAVLLFDGECPLCLKSVGILKRLDWLKVLHFQNARETDHLPPSPVPLIPQRLIEEMHLVTPARDAVYHGFGAFRWMAWRLPLLIAFAPILYIPGVPTIGQRIYLWVAKNRFRLVPCHNGVCTLPPR
jgi:predicted DCC family thiol-disulfide oxidoreductase YuxK